MPNFIDAGLPASVQSRIAARLARIAPDVLAINADLEEFDLGYIKIKFGTTQLVIADSSIEFRVPEPIAGRSA